MFTREFLLLMSQTCLLENYRLWYCIHIFSRTLVFGVTRIYSRAFVFDITETFTREILFLIPQTCLLEKSFARNILAFHVTDMFARVVTVLDVDNTCMYSRHICCCFWGCRHARYALGAPVLDVIDASTCDVRACSPLTQPVPCISQCRPHACVRYQGYWRHNMIELPLSVSLSWLSTNQGRTTVCSPRPGICARGCCCHLSLYGTEFARRFSSSSSSRFLLLLSSTDVFAITL